LYITVRLYACFSLSLHTCFPLFLFFFLLLLPPPRSTLFPYTTLFRSATTTPASSSATCGASRTSRSTSWSSWSPRTTGGRCETRDRKSTRLNSSHEWISYAVFCLKKKKKKKNKKEQSEHNN